jgi:hypothetical protein
MKMNFDWLDLLGSMFVLFWFALVIRMCWVSCVNMVDPVDDAKEPTDLEAFRVSLAEGQGQAQQGQGQELET